MRKAGARAMNQQSTDIAVAAFADAGLNKLAAFSKVSEGHNADSAAPGVAMNGLFIRRERIRAWWCPCQSDR